MRRHRRTIAIGLAGTGLATAAITMGRVWSHLASTGDPAFVPLWPFPALYLIEAVALPAIVLWAVVVGRHRRGACFVPWLAVGALSAMALLGAMSIGLDMALALVFMVPASVLGDEDQSTVSQKMAGFVLGVLFQAIAMFGIIQYLLRRPTSGLHVG